MHEKLTALCAAVGAVGSFIAQALGGWDTGIQTLLVFMAVDFIMGLVCAAVFGKSDKSENGALSSKACWKGLVKKCCTLLIVVCANYADKLIDGDYICNAVIIAFCCAELISVCETAAVMKIMPPPVKWLFDKILDVMKSKGGNDHE